MTAVPRAGISAGWPVTATALALVGAGACQAPPDAVVGTGAAEAYGLVARASAISCAAREVAHLKVPLSATVSGGAVVTVDADGTLRRWSADGQAEATLGLPVTLSGRAVRAVAGEAEVLVATSEPEGLRLFAVDAALTSLRESRLTVGLLALGEATVLEAAATRWGWAVWIFERPFSTVRMVLVDDDLIRLAGPVTFEDSAAIVEATGGPSEPALLWAGGAEGRTGLWFSPISWQGTRSDRLLLGPEPASGAATVTRAGPGDFVVATAAAGEPGSLSLFRVRAGQPTCATAWNAGSSGVGRGSVAGQGPGPWLVALTTPEGRARLRVVGQSVDSPVPADGVGTPLAFGATKEGFVSLVQSQRGDAALWSVVCEPR